MKEVTMESVGLRRSNKHPWVEQNLEETEYLLGETSISNNGNNIVYDSLKNQVVIPLDSGR
uniref:Uncharacterized protein n=1 Tax=Nelumbo nucifera TaxID=4432 RepID=A0A822ZA02_NELNU|nr:TPA_asm: hypothetical protein HUJ06_015723 [Nelumbo nucifera]